MNNQNKFLVQILEKIGTPLFTSVNEVSSRTVMSGQAEAAPSNTQQAETIAKLLTKVTKASALVSEKLDLESKDPDSDDLQISLAAVLSPVVANLYQLTGHTPKDDDIDRVTSYFETLSNFSNNFTSAKEGTQRLENVAASGDAHDQTQNIIQNIMVMVPLVNAVSAFPFGQAADKLLKNVVKRLEKDSEGLCKDIGITGDDADATIKVLNAIVMIYSQCHFSEMARIMSLSEQDRQTNVVTIDNVWTIYEQRIDMLRTLVKALSGNTEETEQASQKAPEDVPQEVKEEVSTPPSDAPVQSKASESSDGGSDASPMSFFSKKD